MHPNPLGKVLLADLLAMHIFEAYRNLSGTTAVEKRRRRRMRGNAGAGASVDGTGVGGGGRGAAARRRRLQPGPWAVSPVPRLLPAEPFIHMGREVYTMRCYGEPAPGHPCFWSPPTDRPACRVRVDGPVCLFVGMLSRYAAVAERRFRMMRYRDAVDARCTQFG